MDKKPAPMSTYGKTSLLIEEILKGGSNLRIRVTGRSMVPFLNSGETVTLVRVPVSGLRRGDLIFFRNSYGAAVLHRIVRKWRGADGRPVFQTMGDALSRCDNPVSAGNIIGKVCRIEKGGSQTHPIDMDSFYQRKMNSLIAAVQFMRAGAYKTFCLLVAAARAIL